MSAGRAALDLARRESHQAAQRVREAHRCDRPCAADHAAAAAAFAAFLDALDAMKVTVTP